MKKFFGFGSSTPPPPPPPTKPPSPPPSKPAAPAKAETPAKPEAAKGETAPAAAPAIIGRWKDPNSGDITEFHADGSVTENVSGAEPIRGRYSLAGDKLKINLDGLPNELSFAATLKADTLEVIDPDGLMTRYRKQN